MLSWNFTLNIFKFLYKTIAYIFSKLKHTLTVVSPADLGYNFALIMPRRIFFGRSAMT